MSMVPKSVVLRERRGDGVPTIRNETWATSGKQATYRLVDDTDLELTIPAARLERTARQRW